MLRMTEPEVRVLIATGQLEPAPFGDAMAVRLPVDTIRAYQATHPRPETHRTVGDRVDDGLGPARGVIVALAIGVALWVGIALGWSIA